MAITKPHSYQSEVTPEPVSNPAPYRGMGCNEANVSSVDKLCATGQAGTILRISFGPWLWDPNLVYQNKTRWMPNVSFLEESYTVENIARAVQHDNYKRLRRVMVGNEEYAGGAPPEQFLPTLLNKMDLWLTVDPEALFVVDAGGVFPQLDNEGNTIGTVNYSIANAGSYWQRLWLMIPRGRYRSAIKGVSLHLYPNPTYNVRQYFQRERKWLMLNQPRLDITMSEIGCPDNVIAPQYVCPNYHQEAVEAGLFCWMIYKMKKTGAASNYHCLLDPQGNITEDGIQFKAIQGVGTA